MPSLLEVIQSTTGYFSRRGMESPRLNAEHLIAHSLGKKRLDLYLEFDRLLDEEELAPMRKLVRARAEGRPLQHLLGTAEFFGRSFLIDERALIPRPETEQLVELILSVTEDPSSPRTVLDSGTGSGVIAITLAIELPGAAIHGTDISPDALSLARENVSRLAPSREITFTEADLIPESPVRFDLIAANLPYIPCADIEKLPREVRNDPHVALDGGVDGLDLISRCVARAAGRLAQGGRIFLEIGHGQAPLVCALLEANNYRDIVTSRDYQSVERFVSALYG